MDVWFLTIVYRGKVSLTSIMVESKMEAEAHMHTEFERLFGDEVAWDIIECNDGVVNIDVTEMLVSVHHKKQGIKATLIQA